MDWLRNKKVSFQAVKMFPERCYAPVTVLSTEKNPVPDEVNRGVRGTSEFEEKTF